MIKKIVAIAIALVFFQNSCSSSSLSGKITTVAPYALAGTSALATYHAIPQKKLNVRNITLGGLALSTLGCGLKAAERFAPEGFKALGMKLGLTATGQAFLAKLPPFVAGAGIGIALGGAYWWNNLTHDVHNEIRWAIVNQNIYMLKSLLEHNRVDLNQVTFLDATNPASNNILSSTIFNCTNEEKCIEILTLLLDHGADINKQDSQGYTALLKALKYEADAQHNYSYGMRYLNIANFLIDRGADVTIGNLMDETPLSLFSKVDTRDPRNISIFNKLIKYKSITADDILPVLEYAIREKKTSVFENLLTKITKSQNVKDQALRCAIESKNIHFVIRLIEIGANVNANYGTSEDHFMNRLGAVQTVHRILCPLTLAYRAADIDLFKEILYDINEVRIEILESIDNDQFFSLACIKVTPEHRDDALITAVRKGYIGAVEQLLQQKLGTKALDIALDFACIHRNSNLIDILAQSGKCSLEALDKALIHVMQHQNLLTTAILLYVGANPRACFNEQTALEVGIIYNNGGGVLNLLRAGRNQHDSERNFTQEDKDKALIIAADRKNITIIRELLAAGANPLTRIAGSSPLSKAFRGGIVDLIECMLGALPKAYNADTFNDEEKTLLLNFAIKNRRVPILSQLLGIDPNIPIAHACKQEALALAIEIGNIDLVEKVVLAGASISTVDAEGKLPEDIARAQNHHEIADFLTEKGDALRDCKVCFDSYPARDFVQLHCGHGETCRTCMLEMINTGLAQRSPDQLTCTDPGCQDKQLNETDLRSISGYPHIALFKGYQEKINYLKTLAWIRAHPNGKGCPSADCQHAFLSSEHAEQIQCSECHAYYCSHCLHNHPQGWTCAQAKQVRESENQSPEAAATARYLADNTKPCPRCETATERTEGCNHMACPVGTCQTHFCFECGNRLEHPYYNGTGVDGTLCCGCRTWPAQQNQPVQNPDEDAQNQG